MKKLLALLLAAMMVLALAACTPAQPVDGTENTEETAQTTLPETTAETPSETGTADTTSAEPASTDVLETTSENASGMTEAAGVADPTGLDKTALVAWYNDRINEVRTKKPKIDREKIEKIDNFETSLLGGIADGAINGLVASGMPGNPEPSVIQKGADNAVKFFSDTASSAVQAGDVTLATVRKEGNNYVVTLLLEEETNPAKTGSKYARVFGVATAPEILDGVKDLGITGDPNNVTVVYSGGKASITVNPQGQIIKAESFCKTTVIAKKVKLAVFNLDLTVYQSSANAYSGFVY